MIPVIEDEIVNNYKLIKREDFYYIIAKAQSIPGVIAFNCSLFLGYEVGGIWGALFSSLGVFLPPFLIILMISIFYENLSKIKIIKDFLMGVKISLSALLLKLSINLVKEKYRDFFSFLFLFLFLILYFIFKINPIFILIFSILIYYLIDLFKFKFKLN